jgi:hypothetical protein
MFHINSVHAEPFSTESDFLRGRKEHNVGCPPFFWGNLELKKPPFWGGPKMGTPAFQSGESIVC